MNAQADIKALVSDTLTDLLSTQWRVSQELAEEFEIEIPEHFRNPQTNPGLSVTPLQLILSKLVKKACQGSDKSIQEVLDRVVGKPQQHIEATATMTYVDYLSDLKDTAEIDDTPVVRKLVLSQADSPENA